MQMDDRPDETVERTLLHAADDTEICAFVSCVFVCARWRCILHPLLCKEKTKSVVEWAASRGYLSLIQWAVDRGLPLRPKIDLYACSRGRSPGGAKVGEAEWMPVE
jgi:hypothetical protein